MAAVIERDASTTSPAGRLRGFDDGAREIDDAPAAVRGVLPGWLHGRLLLNGPARWTLPQGALKHWFDGYAMVHRLLIGDGVVRYRSRFAQSEVYRASLAAGRPVTGEFGTANPAGFWQRLKGLPATDNPAVVISRHGQRWVAVSETPYLTYFDPETLRTEERLDLQPRLHIHVMSAHGYTLDDGSYLNVGVEYGPKCRYKVFRLPPGSREPVVEGEFTVPKSGYLHGFGLAPGHAIVWDLALRVQPLAMRFGGASYKDNHRWQPEGGSALYAVPLAGGQVRRWGIPPLMAFHATQAWADGDDLLLELAGYGDAAVFDDLALERRRAGAPMHCSPQLLRYRLQPGRDTAEPEALGCEMELQQVHPAALGRRRASVCWGISGAQAGGFGDQIVRLDLDRNVQAVWRRDGAMHLEPLFVPRPGGSADDDGVLLVPTLADHDAGSVVAVVDAARMAPLAEIEAPQVVPFGFHAAFAA